MNLQEGSRAVTTRGRGLTSTPEPPAIFAASRSVCDALHVCFAKNITIHHLLKTLNPSLKYSADFPSNKNHGIPCTTFLQPHFLHIRTQDFGYPENCPRENCPPENCPPENCPPENCPPENWPPENFPPENSQGKLPPRKIAPRKIAPLENCPPEKCPRKIAPGKLPQNHMPLK